MNPSSFWQKAADFYSIYHSKYQHAVLTDDERRETVTDYIGDMTTLMSEWYNSQGDGNGRASRRSGRETDMATGTRIKIEERQNDNAK